MRLIAEHSYLRLMWQATTDDFKHLSFQDVREHHASNHAFRVRTFLSVLF